MTAFSPLPIKKFDFLPAESISEPVKDEPGFRIEESLPDGTIVSAYRVEGVPPRYWVVLSDPISPDRREAVPYSKMEDKLEDALKLYHGILEKLKKDAKPKDGI